MGFIYEWNANKWKSADCILKVRESESDLCVTYDRKPSSVTGIQSNRDYLRYLNFDWRECLITVYGMYRTFYIYVDS